jgi:uncharacterized membrane protein
VDFRIAPVWPWWATLILGGGLAAFAVWTYPPGSPRRKTLIALRLSAIVVALFAFARPTLEFSRIIEQSSTLIALYDRSFSMTLQDMWRGLGRWDALRELRTEADPDFKELAEKVAFREFVFDRAPEEADAKAMEQKAEGGATAIGDALDKTLTHIGDERVAGVLLLSDGANNFGIDPSEIRAQLAGRNIPVYAFGFGSETASDAVRDVAPTKLDVSSTAFKKNRLPVRAEFQTTGFGNRSIPVKLLFDGVEKARGELKPMGDGQKGVVELVGIPDKPGEMKVTIEAEVQPGELVATNNATSTYVTVRSDGLNVVHIEGKYRFWEPKFLRRAIDQSPDIDLTQVFLLDTEGRQTDLPLDLFEPGKYDVVILGDLPASRMPPALQEKLATMLRAGAGLLMIGGYESFGPGDWRRSPIADFLPVQMKEEDGQTEAELTFKPTAAGLRHYILRLAPTPELNQKAWESLRPLDGGSLWSGLRQNALVLAETADGKPLMVAQETGRNRSLAFAADSTWRWATKNKEGRAAHAKYWRQLILWLAHREEDSGGGVRLRLDRRRVAAGEKQMLEAYVSGPDGKTPPDVTLETTVKNNDDDSVAKGVALQKRMEGFGGTTEALPKPGDYTVSVTAKAGGVEIGSASAKFVVFEENLELRQLAADFESLRKLAADTGGEFHPAEDFVKFVKSLKTRNLNLEVTKPIIENLWDRWELLAVFIALLGAEWLLRKQNGLV